MKTEVKKIKVLKASPEKWMDHGIFYDMTSYEGREYLVHSEDEKSYTVCSSKTGKIKIPKSLAKEIETVTTNQSSFRDPTPESRDKREKDILRKKVRESGFGRL